MNSLPPYYFAFAGIQQCPSPCTDSKAFPGAGCNYKGVDATSCSEAQKVFNSTNKTGVINTTVPASKPVRHQRLPTPTSTTPKITATASASPSAGASPSVGATITGAAGAGGIASGFGIIPGFDIPGLGDIQKQAQDFLNSLGLPPDVAGIPTPIIVGGGAAILILLLVLKR